MAGDNAQYGRNFRALNPGSAQFQKGKKLKPRPPSPRQKPQKQQEALQDKKQLAATKVLDPQQEQLMEPQLIELRPDDPLLALENETYLAFFQHDSDIFGLTDTQQRHILALPENTPDISEDMFTPPSVRETVIDMGEITMLLSGILGEGYKDAIPVWLNAQTPRLGNQKPLDIMVKHGQRGVNQVKKMLEGLSGGSLRAEWSDQQPL